MSSRISPSCLSCLAVTVSPHTLQTLRLCRILRWRMIWPSSTGSSSSSMAASCCPSTVKTSSTSAYSAPVRIISLSALAPSATLIEPMIMDLPAPVSPVRIFRPSPKVTSISSIKARFFTCKLCNILPPLIVNPITLFYHLF